jgi:hypothetical protein
MGQPPADFDCPCREGRIEQRAVGLHATPRRPGLTDHKDPGDPRERPAESTSHDRGKSSLAIECHHHCLHVGDDRLHLDDEDQVARGMSGEDVD